MLTWERIGCDYGEPLTVVCANGETLTGRLVDFETDYDGSLGGDSIAIALDDGEELYIKEHQIKSMSAA